MENLELPTHHNISPSCNFMPTCGWFYQWTHAQYTSQLVSMVTVIWQSLGLQCTLARVYVQNTQSTSLNTLHGVPSSACSFVEIWDEAKNTKLHNKDVALLLSALKTETLWNEDLYYNARQTDCMHKIWHEVRSNSDKDNQIYTSTIKGHLQLICGCVNIPLSRKDKWNNPAIFFSPLFVSSTSVLPFLKVFLFIQAKLKQAVFKLTPYCRWNWILIAKTLHKL